MTTTAILNPYPGSPSAAVESFSAQLTRPVPGRLTLRYRIDGDIGQLLIPAHANPARRDGLWKHTCVEAFLKVGASPAYYEFNFSPSGEWAAYRFDGYRNGMSPADITAAPAITVSRSASRLDVDVSFPLPDDVMAALPQPLALAAVIEDQVARISYWAVEHAPLKPDFHHDNGFVLSLPQQ